MSRFSYIAMRDSGDRVTGVLKAPSRREAIGKLLELGYHPVAIENEAQQPDGAKQWAVKFFGRVRTTDLAVFTRQLAALLKAGLPIFPALATLRKQSSNRQLKRVIEDLEQSLTQDASSLAEAMAEHPRVFGPVYCGMVHSGEEGGRLIEVLGQLSSHLTRSAKLRGQVVGAFMYPAFLLLMGISAVFILMTFVIPKFQKLFASFGQDLPWPTKVLIGVSGLMADWWWAILLGIIVGSVVAVGIMQRESVRLQVDKLLLRLPVFGAMIMKLEVSRIARTLGALLDGGVRVVQALDITAQTVRSRVIRATFVPIGRSVSTGDPLGLGMEQVNVFPPLAVNMVRTGEETGELSEMLGELADIYDDEAERAVNGAVKLLEPLLIVVMGLVIAGIVAAIMLPILQSSALVA